MCLAVPGKITEIYVSNGLKMCKMDFGGVTREVCLAYVPEAQTGQYGIVHVGFVLNLVDEAEAQETLRMLAEISSLAETEKGE